jgi:hypothetical protein
LLADAISDGISDEISDEITDGITDGISDGITDEITDAITVGSSPHSLLAETSCWVYNLLLLKASSKVLQHLLNKHPKCRQCLLQALSATHHLQQ